MEHAQPQPNFTHMLLHRATEADAEAIHDLVHAAYAPWVPIMGRKPIPMLVDYAEAVHRHIIVLHHIDGALAALIELNPAADHLLVVNVAVAPAFQGRGLGRKLLAHAEHVATSLGLAELRLYTNKLMEPNVKLYRALGYRIDYEEAFKGGIVLHMSKRLVVDEA